MAFIALNSLYTVLDKLIEIFFFLQFFEHNVWVFLIIVAIVIIAMDEVRVHWKAYSISTYEMRCHTKLRFYDIIIGQGNELM